MPPTLKAQQSERTKAALIAAGRRLFAERGYEGVSAEEVAGAADVTTGAVYHQFVNKKGLFRAVLEDVERDVTERVIAGAAAESDPWLGFKASCLAFLDAAADADVRRILLLDGRAVLGWDEWHEVMARYGLGMTRAVVAQLTEAGLLPDLPVEAHAAILFGALNEAALFIATADDIPAARDAVSRTMSF